MADISSDNKISISLKKTFYQLERVSYDPKMIWRTIKTVSQARWVKKNADNNKWQCFASSNEGKDTQECSLDLAVISPILIKSILNGAFPSETKESGLNEFIRVQLLASESQVRRKTFSRQIEK